MSERMCVGEDNISREVTELYTGVANVARDVTSAFVGVDNVARRFFGTILWDVRTNSSFVEGVGRYTRLINKEMTLDNDKTVIWVQYERDNTLASHSHDGIVCQFYVGGEYLAGRTLTFDYEVSSNLTATGEVVQYSIYPGNSSYKISTNNFYYLTTGNKSGTFSLVLDDDCKDLRIGLWIDGEYGSTGNVYETWLHIYNLRIDGEPFF